MSTAAIFTFSCLALTLAMRRRDSPRPILADIAKGIGWLMIRGGQLVIVAGEVISEIPREAIEEIAVRMSRRFPRVVESARPGGPVLLTKTLC